MTDAELAPPAIVETPVEAPPVESESLADHEAAFGPNATESTPDDSAPVVETADTQAERDDKGRFRHRAASQKAGPDDVVQINALTKELRAKEQELAKVRPDALAGSPRLLALKRQIKAIEAELGVTSPVAPAPAPPARPTPAISQREPERAPSGTAFTEREPTMEDYANEADPYSAWQRSLARYDRRKDAFEEQQASEARRVATERQTAEDAQQTAWIQKLQAHEGRVAAASRAMPDFTTVTRELANRTLPNLLIAAVVESDNSEKLMLDLARHPDFLDEVSLLAYGVPVDESSVATLQRRLNQHMQAASTGSAAVSRAFTAPRPPNPVRTGPIHTGDELPGDESSLAAHEKAFGPKRR